MDSIVLKFGGSSLADNEKLKIVANKIINRAKENGKRVILTFGGDKSFILVEETVSKEDEFTVIPTMGEPYMLSDTVGALSDTSITWSSSGVDYYITSTTMDQTEMLEIAKSISLVPTMK